MCCYTFHLSWATWCKMCRRVCHNAWPSRTFDATRLVELAAPKQEMRGDPMLGRFSLSIAFSLGKEHQHSFWMEAIVLHLALIVIIRFTGPLYYIKHCLPASVFFHHHVCFDLAERKRNQYLLLGHWVTALICVGFCFVFLPSLSHLSLPVAWLSYLARLFKAT